MISEISKAENPRPTINHIVLDTSSFIRQKAFDSKDNTKYYTTEYIIKEIKDEKAREYYELNKSLIEIRNPSRDTIKLVSNFARLSNDLKALSIPDLAIISLAYELVQEEGKGSLLRKEPFKYDVIDIIESRKKKTEDSKEEDTAKLEKDGFVEVKSKKRAKLESEAKELENWGDEEWITSENIEEKLNKHGKVSKSTKEENPIGELINVTLISCDFTVQNLSLKIGIPIMSLDSMQIRKIKHYILKCFSCSNFVFDTSKLFCENCGYNTLMKIGCSINTNGRMKIFDKDPEARVRGTQYDLPKPSLSKKGVVYILAEDQLPKKKHEYNLEKDLDKILDNYENGKDFNSIKNDIKYQNTSKQFIWGYPKKNPNAPKKYYSKKSKK